MNEGQEKKVEQAHTELWKRFIGKDGVILDYQAAEADLPTPEECDLGKPNIIGWWSPIENGSFFNGLYLYALCRRAQKSRSPEDFEKARTIARGLLLLSGISKVPGFIGRGVGADGKCHYALGSDDQTHPWFYGLYQYLRSGIPDAEEHQLILKKMTEVAEIHHQSGWCSPCDGRFTGEFRGNLSEGDYRGSVRLLFILRAMEALTRDEKWGERYHRALREIPHGAAFDRLTICSHSYLLDEARITDIRKQMWIVAGAQASLADLITLETDPSIRKAYHLGLTQNAAFAAEALKDCRNFSNEDVLPFRVSNWRTAFSKWQPQPTQKEAQVFAEKQLHDLDQIDFDEGKNPRRWSEQHLMRQPLAAAWIVALGADDALKEKVKSEWENVLMHYNYSKLQTSIFFFAECAWQAWTGKPVPAAA